MFFESAMNSAAPLGNSLAPLQRPALVATLHCYEIADTLKLLRRRCDAEHPAEGIGEVGAERCEPREGADKQREEVTQRDVVNPGEAIPQVVSLEEERKQNRTPQSC